MLRLLPLLGFGLLLAGCGPRLIVEKMPGVQLPGEGTYAWGKGNERIPGDNNPRVDNDIASRLIHQAVDNGLAKRGYRQTTDAPAWAVHYHAGIERKSEVIREPTLPHIPRVICTDRQCVDVWDWGYWGPPEYSTRTIEYHEGTLIIDIHDARSNQLVWRGILSDQVNIEKAVNPEKLQSAVDRLLRELPENNNRH